MDKKISQLTAATTPLTGAEELALVQSGVTKKTTVEEMKGYKSYVALMTSPGAVAPVATVLENTIGNIVWTRDSPGDYYANLVGAFPASQTWLSCNPLFIDDVRTANFIRIDDNTIRLSIPSDDGLISNFSIEIRVYP